MEKEILIVDARRTAVASPFKGLKEFSAAQLAAFVARDIFSRNQIPSSEIDEVIFGNAVGAGTGQNLARQVISLSGLPLRTPGYVVNAVCGSGLQAVILAARAIACGDAQAVLAGGTESASQAPLMSLRGAQGENVESGFYDGLRCAITGESMGSLCETLAQENHVSREEQDSFACSSHQKACTARAAGLFKDEIVPVQSSKKIFQEDERPRSDVDMKRLEQLPPAFSQEGSITAGNSSSPADGACALLMASSNFVKKNNLKPLARICGYAHVALAPQDVFTGAVAVTKGLMERHSLRVKDINLFEITESFAAQAIYTQNEVNIPSEKFNVFGGDVALGHPLGAAGTRALVTLVHILRQTKKVKGLVSVCFGGGGAIAMIVENIS